MSREINEDAAMEEIVERLSNKYPEVPRETVAQVVDEVRQTMQDAHVRDFVPVLVEREAKKRVKQLR